MRKMCIQAVPEIRVLIITSEKTRQFINLFSNISQKFSKIFASKFLPN
jgi:hypothetical protein